MVRLKRMLKNAYRTHKLKAISVEPLAVVATPGESSANESSASAAGQPGAIVQAAGGSNCE